LFLGLRKAQALRARRLSIKSDSELITNHIGKTYRALKPELAKYLAVVRSMEKYFLGFNVRSFPRTQNKQADILAKVTAENDPLPPDVFFETIKSGSVNCAEEPAKFVNAISSEDWRTKIMAYLRGHFVPEDEKEEKQLALRARSYSIINDALYHGGVCAPLLKCISQTEGRQLLQAIHWNVLFAHRNKGPGGKSFPRRLLLAFGRG